MRLLVPLLSALTVYLGVGFATGYAPNLHLRRTARPQVSDRQLWLIQAESDLTPRQFVAGSMAVALLVFVVALGLTGAWWLAMVPSIGAYLFPRGYYGRRRMRRLNEVREAWPDGLRDMLASIGAGSTLVNALISMAQTGPLPLQRAWARFGLLARMMGAVPALELTKEELGDATSDEVIEVLILAYEHGGDLTMSVLRNLIDETTEDLRLEAEIRTDGVEQRLESRVVVFIPWALLLYLAMTSEPYRVFYQSPRGLAVVILAGLWSGVGVVFLRYLHRQQTERRVLGGSAVVNVEGLSVIGALPLVAIGSSVVFGVATAGVVMRPPRRLAPRVRPYTATTRAELRRSPDAFGQAAPGPMFGEGTIRRLIGPIVSALVDRLGRLVTSASEEQLRTSLRQSGLYGDLPEALRPQAYRIRSLGRAMVLGVGIGALGLVLRGTVTGMFVFGALGFTLGVLMARSSLQSAVSDRRDRIRSELYTINQLVAMRTRVGGGAIEAIRHVVSRAHGAVIDELGEALRLHERGWSFGESMIRAAELTPEPEAARTYRMIATSQERGADLADALLGLAKDLRSSRRDHVREQAAKRRIMMVIPIVVILAPVTLLFLGAPIPSIILGT